MHLLDLQRRRVVAGLPLAMHDAIAAGPGDDVVLDLVLRPHAGAQDVLPGSLLLLQFLDRLLADHAPIGHDADLGDSEPAAEPIDYRNEGRDIGRVARPQLTADRSPLTIEHGPNDHLLEVRPVILAIATLTDRLSPLSLEVDGGRIEEDQLEPSEQVTPSGEERLLDQVLVAAGSERCLVGLLLAWQFFAQPTHRPVEVMKVKIFASIDLVTLLPLVGCAIAAGVKEPMEDGEEDGSLKGKLEKGALEKLLNHMLAAGQLPEPLEDQGRADVPYRDGREPALSMLGEQQDRAGQACTGGKQAVSLPLSWS